jgi:DNA (cytosine-5)-methyltransferase 1
MNVLDLFSGIGGFSLGLERAGMRTVAFCEPNDFCRKILRKHWSEVPIYRDVRRLSGSQILHECGSIDLVCGGFPCQPFSVAGEQRGSEDDRHLWPHMRQVIEWMRPAWVIAENVTGIIELALDDVLLDLESLGYTTRTLVIPACGVGAPHRRYRVWVVAHAKSLQRPAELGEQSHGDVSSHWGTGWRDYAQEIRGMDDGIPGRVDGLASLGNSIVPGIAEMLGRAIVRATAGESLE